MSNTEAALGPRTFISYSWSSPEHEEWVLGLASDLRELGVDVVLDKWEVWDGDDPYPFMERIVTDPELKKVVLVCDREYVRKADAREGGVGAEAQILTPELYRLASTDTESRHTVFGVFARAESHAYFDLFKGVLGVSTMGELRERAASLGRAGRLFGSRVHIPTLIGAERIAMRP